MRPPRAASRTESIERLSFDFPKAFKKRGDVEHVIPPVCFALLDCQQADGLKAPVIPELCAQALEVFAGIQHSPLAALGPCAGEHDLSQEWMASLEAGRYPDRSRLRDLPKHLDVAALPSHETVDRKDKQAAQSALPAETLTKACRVADHRGIGES